ncbi:MAG: hypothetical protein IJD36_01790, partial [Clostridia bacterium]|nr:hypothetical protein [Clostridia bacterium]
MLKNLRGRISRVSVKALKRRAAFVLVMMFIVTTCSGFIFSAQNTVTITDAGRAPIQVKTGDTNVAKILSKQGIVLNHGDEMNYNLLDDIREDAVIEIYRASTVNVNYMGEVKTLSTTK